MKRVFLSSTLLDLKNIRDEARTALRRINYIDIAMEYFAAENTRPADKCIELVRSADLYIAILAWRYGYVLDDYNRSITELEYETAQQNGKPCIILALSDSAPWPTKFIDTDRTRIENFRNMLAKRHMLSFFKNRADFAARLYEAIRTYEDSFDARRQLAEVIDEHDRILSTIADAQGRMHSSLRLFDLQRDVRITDVYVQEILDTKTEQGPFGHLEPMRRRAKSERMIDSKLLVKLCADESTADTYTFEGRAGAGKSTMMKMWLLNSLDDWRADPSRPLPFYVNLCGVELKNAVWPSWLQEAVCRSTPSLSPEVIGAALDDRSPGALLKKPRFLVLADSLDEMSVEHRKTAVGLATSVPPSFKLALSARTGIFAETGYPARSLSYELCDFEWPQIEEYVTKWFAATPAYGSSLLERIGHCTRLKDLASIPLLLTCLTIHTELNGGFQLSDNIVEHDLIRAAVEILIERWDAWKEGRAPDLDFVTDCMSIFARLTVQPRHQNMSWNDIQKLCPELKGNPTLSRAFAERILSNGRILSGTPRDGYGFTHGIFYDFFFQERLAQR